MSETHEQCRGQTTLRSTNNFIQWSHEPQCDRLYLCEWHLLTDHLHQAKTWNVYLEFCKRGQSNCCGISGWRGLPCHTHYVYLGGEGGGVGKCPLPPSTVNAPLHTVAIVCSWLCIRQWENLQIYVSVKHTVTLCLHNRHTFQSWWDQTGESEFVPVQQQL